MPVRFLSVWIILVLFIFFVPIGAQSDALRGSYLDAAIVFVLFVLLVSAIARKWFDAGFAALLGVVFAAVRFAFPGIDQPTLALRTFSTSAYVLLHFVLLIGPWSRFSTWVQQRFLRHRRHLGVATYMLAAGHFALVFATYYGRSFEAVFAAGFTYFGFVAYLILLPMALTSWNWFMQLKVRWVWHAIHLGLLGLYLGISSWYVALAGRHSLAITPWQWMLMGLFVLLWIAVAPWGFARQLPRLWGWKHLHMLVYVAYAATVQHAWSGIFQYQPLWQQLLFWALFTLVIGSHLTGWVVRWRKRRGEPHQNSETQLGAVGEF